MFQRPAELLQLEALPCPGLCPSATLLRLISQATSVGLGSPPPAGVLKLVAQWDGGGDGSENRILGFKVTPNSTWTRTVPGSRRKSHSDLMQGSSVARGSDHSTFVLMVVRAHVLACSLEQEVAKKRPQLPSDPPLASSKALWTEGNPRSPPLSRCSLWEVDNCKRLS